MSLKLFVTGVNHNTAPVEIREKIALGEEDIHPMLRHLDRENLIKEGVLLSTCNRTEIYFLPGPQLSEPADVIEAICQKQDISFDAIDPHAFEHEQMRGVEHCFEVAGSLNSMVVGESQILGQVKDAYSIAREGGFCGKFTHHLFQESFRIAKKIRSQTNICRLPTSVGSCAVALASQIFNDLSEQNILVIGGGEMAQLCMEHLAEENVKNIKVANRTLSNAKELARKYDGQAYSLDHLKNLLKNTDIILTSTGSRDPILKESMINSTHQERGNQPLFIIDIAVPRDVNTNVSELENVYLYDIDSLEDIGHKNIAYRKQEVSRAEKIIENGIKQFEEWIKTQDMGPFIKELKQEVYQLVEEELRENLNLDRPNLQRSDLQLVAHRITNKLLDDPVNVIKEKAIEEEQDSLSTVQELFNLETNP